MDLYRVECERSTNVVGILLRPIGAGNVCIGENQNASKCNYNVMGIPLRATGVRNVCIGETQNASKCNYQQLSKRKSKICHYCLETAKKMWLRKMTQIEQRRIQVKLRANLTSQNFSFWWFWHVIIVFWLLFWWFLYFYFDAFWALIVQTYDHYFLCRRAYGLRDQINNCCYSFLNPEGKNEVEKAKDEEQQLMTTCAEQKHRRRAQNSDKWYTTNIG